MDKKFFVNGREKEWFYLTNRELVDLLKDEKTSEEDKKYLNDAKIIVFFESTKKNKKKVLHKSYVLKHIKIYYKTFAYMENFSIF